ncbi:MAG TPA: O-phospho-L-seryl-tRNA:Cys-tRNA synthase [Candidatus Deferrimicrobium sp.]|nr:O-phospho-L-seryl-tRNA:Cys-tRNA synthase [Candidatus Deferrimicrobium sp.]
MKINKEKIQRYANISRDIADQYINIHPIQRGGVLTPEAQKILLSYGDGYSMCDYCFEGRVDRIDKPPVREFLEDLALFLEMDEVRVTPGSRTGMFIVFRSMSRPGDTIILDSLAHYSTYIAAEAANLKIKEVPHRGYPEYILPLEDYQTKIDEVKKETGKKPVLLVLTHVDYNYGNVNDLLTVGKIAEENEIPFVMNGAYSVGLMPISGKKVKADFILGSGHKSMAASGPIGVLATIQKWADKVFQKSRIEGDWSKRKFSNKEFLFLGCSPCHGAPLATFMASFPTIVDRVEHWDEEVKKSRCFVEEMEKIEGMKMLGKRPKEHTLIQFESESFHQVAQQYTKKGYFLYNELKKRSIVGLHVGMTKHFKVNIYGLSWDQVRYIASAFQEIARTHEIAVKE